jgi:hypothetical protein
MIYLQIAIPFRGYCFQYPERQLIKKRGDLLICPLGLYPVIKIVAESLIEFVEKLLHGIVNYYGPGY